MCVCTFCGENTLRNEPGVLQTVAISTIGEKLAEENKIKLKGIFQVNAAEGAVDPYVREDCRLQRYSGVFEEDRASSLNSRLLSS